MRLRAKRDQAEKPIIEALEAFGAIVEQVSSPGIPDLIVAYRDVIWLLEVKTGRGRVTPKQRQCRLPCITVRSADEALRVVVGVSPSQ